MNATLTTVLVVGDITAGSATLRRWLNHRSRHCHFASSFQEACRFLSQNEFDLVLCRYDLSDRTAFPLFDWLEGSRSTLLFSAGSGQCARWLPVIERGKRRLDQPLVLTEELPKALETLLEGAHGTHPTGTAAPAVEPEHVVTSR